MSSVGPTDRSESRTRTPRRPRGERVPESEPTTTTREQAPTPTAGEWISNTFKIATPIFLVVAAVTYAILRFFYERFYAKFGVTPEQVGLGRTELLTQSVAGPVMLLLIVAMVVALLVVIFAVFYGGTLAFLYVGVLQDFIRAFRALRKKQSFRDALFERNQTVLEELQEVGARLRRRLRKLPVFTVALSLVTGLWAVGFDLSRGSRIADDVLERGRAGHPVVDGVGPFKATVLNVHAEPLAVQWKSRDVPPAFQGTNADCLMYLGENEGIVVAYDVRSRRSMRFSSSDAVILVSTDTSLPEFCTEHD